MLTKKWVLKGTSPSLIANSNIIADNIGNVFLIDVANRVFRIDGLTQQIDMSAPLSSNLVASGKFAINKQTGTVYLSGTDKNIYQIHFANGKWNTPFLLSYIANTYSQKTIGKDYPSIWGAYGNMVFSNPNIFYISADGYVRVVQYNTNNTCIALHVRMGNDVTTALVEGFTVYPNPTNNSDATLKFNLSENKTIDLVLRNNLGEIVQTIVNNQQFTEGEHALLLNTQQLSSGIYFVTFTKNNTESQTIKVIVNQ